MTNGQGIRAGRFENQKEDYNENHSRTKSNDSCTGLIRSVYHLTVLYHLIHDIHI